MIIVILIVFGLCLGSFVNALVWRMREQELLSEKPKSKTAKKSAKKLAAAELSIVHGRSVCPNCHHKLQARDLIPILSWVSLRGKCRYCSQRISWQYPVVELVTASFFVISYVFWPNNLHGSQIALFILWLLLIVGFMALVVYDLKWYLLPNRIVYPLAGIAAVYALVTIASDDRPGYSLLLTLSAVAVGGGIFYALFQVSKGKWIGGGDVKLGWMLGLLVGSPSRSFLFIFLAALGGSLVSLPLLATKRLKPTTVIPFGPFLIVGAIITVLFGTDILHWYQRTLLEGSY